jgi:hypothetical protein
MKMTRDEAFKIVKPMYGGATDEIIDIWQKLGMLKLDEPSQQVTLWKILRAHCVPLDVAQWVCNDALNAGLIVEK